MKCDFELCRWSHAGNCTARPLLQRRWWQNLQSPSNTKQRPGKDIWKSCFSQINLGIQSCKTDWLLQQILGTNQYTGAQNTEAVLKHLMPSLLSNTLFSLSETCICACCDPNATKIMQNAAPSWKCPIWVGDRVWGWAPSGWACPAQGNALTDTFVCF